MNSQSSETAEPEVTVPASLIEDIHYRLSRYDVAGSRSNAGYHLGELWNDVVQLATWHPGWDSDHGTLPWQRDDEDGMSLPPEKSGHE